MHVDEFIEMTFEANIRDFGEKKLTIFSQKIVEKKLENFF